MKSCTLCKTAKPLADFCFNRTQRDGHHYRCKTCEIARSQSPNSRYNEYRKGARTRGIPFLLSRDELLSFWRAPCTYCGHEIKTVGLDRIDNTRGYELGNVCPCCEWCNRAKSSLTRQQFLDLCRRVAARHPS